jgi:hypothetical protein
MLAAGAATAEALSDQERASIAVETPLTRALRWACAVDGIQHLAVVGPRGTGKTFAVQMAPRFGFVGFDLPPADAPETSNTERRLHEALREERRILLAVRPGDLDAWLARSDLSSPVATMLEQVTKGTGARQEWPVTPGASVAVLDLNCVVTTRAEVVQELLRRAASLVLRGPLDAAREAASIALRIASVRAWACACAADAEGRLGPLSISDLWRFVAHLASGGRAPDGRTRFDLADSVASRLLGHEFMSGRLREFAHRQPDASLEALAAHAGFEGRTEDLDCSDPERLRGQSAIFLADLSSLEAHPDDYDALVSSMSAGGIQSATAALPPTLAHLLRGFSPARVLRSPRPSGVSEKLENYSATATLTLAWPNSFTRRAVGGACAPSLCVQGGERTVLLAARDYHALVSLAARGTLAEVARHPAILAWRGLAEDALVVAPTAQEREAPVVAEDARQRARARSVEPSELIRWGSTALAWRPLGLLLALSERGALDAATRECGAFRVASPADLAAQTSNISATEHVDRLGVKDQAILGGSLREFLAARSDVVVACARLAAGLGSDDANALAASTLLEVAPESVSQADVVVRRYVDAYAALVEAAVVAGGDTLERVLMLDVAYSVGGGQRRARLMPLHPLMAARASRGSADDGGLPPVIALRHGRVIALFEEGEPGFYQSESERWPSVIEQREALARAVRAWLARDAVAATLQVDLVDALFATPLVAAISSAVADHARGRDLPGAAVHIRALATSSKTAVRMPPPSCASTSAPTTISVSCDPSVRSSAEAQEGSLVFVVAPAPHGGRQPQARSDNGSLAEVSYGRALSAVGVNGRPHRLDASTEPTVAYSALMSWAPDPAAQSRAGSSGRWRLTLRGDLTSTEAVRSIDRSTSPVAAVQPTSASPPPVAPPREEPPAVAPPQATRARPAPEPPRQKTTAEGAPLVGVAPSMEVPRRRWTREELKVEAARSCGRRSVGSDEAMVADLVRDTVFGRRAPLRHGVIRDVVECAGPLLADGDPADVVTRAVEALVDLGDLVARRSGARGPYLLEPASAAFVNLRDTRKLMLLGRGESTLSDEVRAAVVTSGRLRMIDAARASEARDELRFHGAAELSWAEWSRVPRPSTPDDALRSVRELSRFAGDIAEFDAFDPTTAPAYYRGRFRAAILDQILLRDSWAVASRDADFDAKDYRLFRRADGVTSSVAIDRSRFVELAAACAARAAGGRRFLARVGEGAVRLYFPPPRWLSRLLALGTEVDPGDALVAWRLPGDLEVEVREAISRGLWCEVVSV